MKIFKRKSLAEKFLEMSKTNLTRDDIVYQEAINATLKVAQGGDILQLENMFQSAPYNALDIINIISGVLHYFPTRLTYSKR
jgi:hypothetical protein